MDQQTTDSASAERGGEATLSTGVVIRGKRVPDEILRRAFQRARTTEPKPPLWFNPSKGRQEPNESDPDYIAAKERHAIELGLYMENALIMYGIEVVSVPDGFPGPDSAEWAEEIALTGMASGASAAARLFDWLTIKAGPHDRNVMFRLAGRATGTLEVDVDEATKSV